MATIPNIQSGPWANAPHTTVSPSCSLQFGNWFCSQLIHDNGRHCIYAARPHQRPHDWPLDYVVKVLDQKLETNQFMVKSLQREAAIGSQLANSHLAPVITAQLTAPPYYIVYPRLPGTSLCSVLDNNRPLPCTIALWVIRQTSEALQRLHQAKWLHGDIKPDNIFVSPNGHVTLLDLGAIQPIGDSNHITDAPFMSTLHYTAPECYHSRLTTDVRSDIYSVGVIFFECLTGFKPFAGVTTAEIVNAHRRKSAPDLRSVMPSLPPRIVELVQCMLAKNPLRRPHTTETLIRRLVSLEIDTFSDHAA